MHLHLLPGRPALLLLLLFPLLLSSCGPEKKSDPNVRHYEVRGVVRGFAPDRTTIEIEHEAIPDFMPAMTMPFTPRDPKEIANLRVGDAISFRLEVTATDFSIANVKKIDAAALNLPKPTSTAVSTSGAEKVRIKEGDMLPAFTLTDEAGEVVTAETLRGHPTVLTFVFTRCPIPNFCPLMARNFFDLQQAIQAGSGSLADTRLLSITIDPEYDTPAVLKEYSQQQGADSRTWSFATGDPGVIDDLTKRFAVYRQNEGGTISHGLTTALIDGEGKVTKIWRGNGWKTEEVLREIDAPKE